MELETLFKTYNLPARGVIHIGGEGEEMELYERMGFQKILFVQHDLEKFEKIKERVAYKKRVLGVWAALASKNGYGLSGDQPIPIRRLDTMLLELRVHPKEFNCLQGRGTGEAISLGAETIKEHFDVWCERATTTPFLNLWERDGGRFGNRLFEYFMANQLCRVHGMQLRTSPWVGQSLFGINDGLLERPAPVVCDARQVREESNMWKSMRTTMGHMGFDYSSPMADPPFNCCLEGLYQFHTGGYSLANRELFRALFQPVPVLKTTLEKALEGVMGSAKTLVAIHLRRDDYLRFPDHPMFYPTPAASYLRWLDAIWGILNKPVLYIASDDPTAHAEFMAYQPKTAADMAVGIAEQFYVDFWVMTQAHALAISNSSFSFAAAMLNENAGDKNDWIEDPGMEIKFVRPLRDGSLRPFDPWNDDVLLGREEDERLRLELNPFALANVTPDAQSVIVQGPWNVNCIPPFSDGTPAPGTVAMPAFPTSEDAVSMLLAELMPQVDPDREGVFIEVGLGTFAWDFVAINATGVDCFVVEPRPIQTLRNECVRTSTPLFEGVMSGRNGASLFFEGNSPDMSSVDPNWFGVDEEKRGAREVVRSVRYGTFCATRNINAVTALKIDAEGMDAEIVCDLEHVPASLLPKIVVFEYGGTNRVEGKGGWTEKALAGTLLAVLALQRMGYRRLLIAENHRALKEIDLPLPSPNLFEDDAVYGNLLAVR